MPTILIIDDHVSVRTALHKLMDANFKECQVLEAASGEEGVVLARRHSPAVVLMDIALTGINGLDATRQIKTIRPKTSVIMLTLYHEDVYQDAARAAGADFFVTKSDMQGKLIPFISQILAKTEQAGPEEVH